MWACAHWCASPIAGTTQQFPNTNIRRSGAKDKPGRGRFWLQFGGLFSVTMPGREHSSRGRGSGGNGAESRRLWGEIWTGKRACCHST